MRREKGRGGETENGRRGETEKGRIGFLIPEGDQYRFFSFIQP
jgi:hypothetical protein